jgi:NAD(P)-dependent dehydrogenase (short-subunit alcohol dehydrogenase family)
MVRTGRKPAIVNIASMAGKQGRVLYLADDVASKFGVVGITQAMA